MHYTLDQYIRRTSHTLATVIAYAQVLQINLRVYLPEAPTVTHETFRIELPYDTLWNNSSETITVFISAPPLMVNSSLCHMYGIVETRMGPEYEPDSDILLRNAYVGPALWTGLPYSNHSNAKAQSHTELHPTVPALIGHNSTQHIPWFDIKVCFKYHLDASWGRPLDIKGLEKPAIYSDAETQKTTKSITLLDLENSRDCVIHTMFDLTHNKCLQQSEVLEEKQKILSLTHANCHQSNSFNYLIMISELALHVLYSDELKSDYYKCPTQGLGTIAAYARVLQVKVRLYSNHLAQQIIELTPEDYGETHDWKWINLYIQNHNHGYQHMYCVLCDDDTDGNVLLQSHQRIKQTWPEPWSSPTDQSSVIGHTSVVGQAWTCVHNTNMAIFYAPKKRNIDTLHDFEVQVSIGMRRGFDDDEEESPEHPKSQSPPRESVSTTPQLTQAQRIVAFDYDTWEADTQAEQGRRFGSFTTPITVTTHNVQRRAQRA